MPVTGQVSVTSMFAQLRAGPRPDGNPLRLAARPRPYGHGAVRSCRQPFTLGLVRIHKLIHVKNDAAELDECVLFCFRVRGGWWRR